MTRAEKLELIAASVTLNGHAAIVSGAEEPFAVVRTLAPAGKHTIRAEWSWPSARHIIRDLDGKFII
jgi:hypothetical protein